MIVVAAIEVAQAPAETRIDTFDTNSKRTGYIIINQQTGRIDQFDTHGNRLGYGYSTPTVPGRGADLLDRNGRPISIDRRGR